MNKNLKRTAIRLAALIVLVAWASWAPAAPGGKPVTGVPHPCDVTVADREGDSILSDGGGIYLTNVVAAVSAKLGDRIDGSADIFRFVVDTSSGRQLKLSIPDVTDGDQTCDNAIFDVNVNESDYQFYNDLPIGESTFGDQNFGGHFECRFGPTGQYTNLYGVSYESQCIVITHTAEKVWTLTADPGCTAGVNKILKRKVVDQWALVNVPFQLTACEIPCCEMIPCQP